MNPAQTLWNNRFAAPGYLFGTEPNAFLAAQAHRLRPGQRVLAVADGEGRNGTFLAKRGLDVLSVDFSDVALAKARALAADAKVALRTGIVDLATWDWEGAPWDVVVAIFIQFADPALRTRLFQRMQDSLAPGGLLLLAGYTPRQLEYKTGGPPQAEHLYTEAMLREAFAGLEILHLQEHDAEIDEGPGHRGMSALIDMVARRPG